MKKTIDTKGIAWFLIITFGLTIGLAVYLKSTGHTLADGKFDPVVTFSLAGAMFIPAITSVFVRLFITKEGFKDAGLKWGKWKYYGQTWLVILLLFILVFGLTALFIKRPDLSLGLFTAKYGLELPMPAYQMIMLVSFSTLFLAPIINMLPSFGEELGWRGFLLPKLLPLGYRKALIIHGIIWGLWHSPFVILLGFAYGNTSILSALIFTMIITFLGIYFGWLRLISGSVWLPTFAHAVFNAHSYGIWRILFPDINPYLGGVTGLIGFFTFYLFSFFILNKVKKILVV